MFTRIVAVIVAFSMIAAGCNKKSKEDVADTAPPPKGSNDPKPSGGGGSGVGIVPAGGVGIVTNPGAIAGGGGGGGAAQAVRKAAKRTVNINELKQFGLEIKQMELLDGRMPDQQTMIAAAKGYPNLSEAIAEGSIILTGTKSSSGLWAYEAGADERGGLVLVGGTASRASADEVQQYLRALN